MDKWVDIYFYSGLMICFILFTVEIILNSIALDDFKYSFYFWLDIIATLSLIPDIIWLSELLNFLIGSGSYYGAVDVTPGAIKNAGQSIIDTSKIVKSLRLIRMIRIIKLYKYVSKTSEFKGSEGGDAIKVEEQDFNRKTDLSKLCRILSDMTTRKVIIIGVLLMLMLPLLTYSQLDFSGNYGLRELFWFGRSNCVNTTLDFFCEPGQSWITQEGWNQLSRQFVDHKDDHGGSGIGVLWIYAPEFSKNGQMSEVSSIPNVDNNGTYWEANTHCGGFEINHSDCDLRIAEMDIISYRPEICANNSISGCEQLVSYSRLDIKEISKEQASLQFFTTIFTCVFIMIGSISFNIDTQRMVNKPITKIVEIIRNFNKPNPIDDKEEESSHMKTKMIELAIFKISILLKRGFGELGAETISENLKIEDEDKKQMPGSTQYAIFLSVKISEFDYITDVLQEEIIVFLNKIVRILHETVKKWDGVANKNFGNKYLMTWLLPDEHWEEISEMNFRMEKKATRIYQEMIEERKKNNPDGNLTEENKSVTESEDEKEKKKKKKKKTKKARREEEERKKKEEEERQKQEEELKKQQEEDERITISEEIQEVADKTLITAIKIISEVRRASDLSAYATHPKLGSNYNNFKTKLSISMHVGSLIEGVVGSNFKIDHLYLPSSLSKVCEKLHYFSEDVYKTTVIMSEDFKNCLSQATQKISFTRPVPEGEIETEPQKVVMKSLRCIDRVQILNENSTSAYPIDLYSFDINPNEIEIEIPETHELGDIVVTSEMEEFVDMERVKKFPIQSMFTSDEDIFSLQMHRANNDFYLEFQGAIEAYLEGDWEYSIDQIEKCLEIDPEDGPCHQLKEFITDDHNMEVPEDWFGYRVYQPPNIMRGPFGDSEEGSLLEEDDDEEASESEP